MGANLEMVGDADDGAWFAMKAGSVAGEGRERVRESD